MIQANELRLGNYLYGNISKQYYLIDIDVLRFIVEEGNVKSLHDNSPAYSAIPLTHEILEKIPTIKYNQGIYSFQRKHIIFSVTPASKKVALNFASGVGEFGIDIEYLHELQNLYFALTGEELTVIL